MSRAFKEGDQFNDESSPLDKLTIGRVMRTEGTETFHEIKKGTQVWTILSLTEVAERAFPPLLPGDVLVVSGGIPAIAMIVYHEDTFSVVYSSVYLSDHAGVDLQVNHHYSQVPANQVLEGVRQLCMEAASVHHRGIFRGRTAAPEYQKKKPYVYLR